MLKRFSLTAGFCVLFFLIIEGLCSSLFVAAQLWSPQEHMTLSGPSVRYDEELGWVSVPNFYERNYFGPGIYLRTNSRGFRADKEFTQQVPPGKVRIICSGDSFTFGDGVANDHTWCQDLESMDDRLQTVNLGESGYGVDQMYLRFKSQSSMLEHDVHVFAFITDDFRRLQLTGLGGYGKPVLKLQNGELAITNIPVPKNPRVVHAFDVKLRFMREFRSISLALRLLGRILPPRRDVAPNSPTSEQEQIIDKLLEDLQAIESRNHSVLVLVYLPRVSDFDPIGPSVGWRAFIRSESVKRGFGFIDFVDQFQSLPITMKDGMFIWPGSVQYFTETPGHYDDQGHEYVARELHARLMLIPQIAAKLSQHSSREVAMDSVDSIRR